MTVTRHKTVLELDTGPAVRQVQGLGQTMERAFDPAIIEGFERSVERLDRTINQLVSSLDKVSKKGLGGGGGGSGGGGGGGSGGGGGGSGGGGRGFMGGFAGHVTATGIGTFAGNALYGGYQRAQGAAATAASGSGFVGSMLSGIPIIGPALGGAVSGIQGFHQQYLGQQRSVLGGYGSTGLGNRGMQGLYGAGGALGLGPGAIPGLMQGYGQQTGLTGGALAGIAPQLMAAQQMRGFGNLGSILGGAGAAGGKLKDPGQMLEDAISSGFQIGIRESRMDQHLAQMGGWVESVRNQGINLSMASAVGLVNTMGNLGLKGGSGMRVTKNFQQAMGGLGKGGGFGQIAALRAAGLGNGRTLVQAQLHAEEHPEDIMMQLAKDAAAQGRDPESASLMIRSVMESLGVQVSASEALTLANNAAGDLTSAQPGQEKSAAQAARRAKGFKDSGVNAASAEAALERRGQGVGASVSGEAIRIRKVEMKLAQTVLPRFSQGIEGAVNALDHLVSSFDPKKTLEMNAGTVILEAGELFIDGLLGNDGKGPKGKTSPLSGTDWEFSNENQSTTAKVVRAVQKGDVKSLLSMIVGGDEGGGNAKEKAVHHARKLADAIEEDAMSSNPTDSQLMSTAN